MAFYQFQRQQLLKASPEQVWHFMSSPGNLNLITPPDMRFAILTEDLPKKMYPGLIISYRVSPLRGIRLQWVTEITQVRDLEYFVDEQRKGPYRMWHHQHILVPTAEGVIMKDIVSYIPPFGILGRLINALLIRKRLKEIFDFRRAALNRIFDNHSFSPKG